MNRKKILDAIEIRKRCVALACDGGHTYFALSGSDQSYTDKIAVNVQSILGPMSKRCLLKDTFTVIGYSTEFITNLISPYYKSVEDNIYNLLNIYKETAFIFPDYLGTKVHYEEYMSKYRHFHSLRNYSCGERKILGYLGKNSVKIYVGMNPCYYCLPALRSIVYLSRETHKLTELEIRRSYNIFYFKRI